jgi:hypothetical protein
MQDHILSIIGNAMTRWHCALLGGQNQILTYFSQGLNTQNNVNCIVGLAKEEANNEKKIYVNFALKTPLTF